MLSASKRIVKPLIAEESCGKLILLNGPQLTVPLWTKTWVMSRISIKFPSIVSFDAVGEAQWYCHQGLNVNYFNLSEPDRTACEVAFNIART